MLRDPLKQVLISLLSPLDLIVDQRHHRLLMLFIGVYCLNLAFIQFLPVKIRLDRSVRSQDPHLVISSPGHIIRGLFDHIDEMPIHYLLKPFAEEMARITGNRQILTACSLEHLHVPLQQTPQLIPFSAEDAAGSVRKSRMGIDQDIDMLLIAGYHGPVRDPFIQYTGSLRSHSSEDPQHMFIPVLCFRIHVDRS